MPKRYKVLITGSSGMLGTDLCKELAKDYDIFGADLAHSFVKLDITDKKSVFDIIKKIKPDIVIHTAAWTDVDGCELDKEKAYRVNAEGTANIASACKETDAVLIYISTDFVFDGKKRAPYIETDKTNPLSVYADSKLKGEEAIIKSLKRYFILRTSWLYGKNGKNFVDTIISKAKGESVLKVVNDQVGSPTYSKDLAQAIHALIDKINKGQGIYHVSNAGSISWYEYAKEILKITGARTKVVPISSEELARPARRPAMSILDNSKFMELTKYRMSDWKSALREYLKK